MLSQQARFHKILVQATSTLTTTTTATTVGVGGTNITSGVQAPDMPLNG